MKHDSVCVSLCVIVCVCETTVPPADHVAVTHVSPAAGDRNNKLHCHDQVSQMLKGQFTKHHEPTASVFPVLVSVMKMF